MCAPYDIRTDLEHGVGAVPEGTQGTIVKRDRRLSREHGYVRIRWDNGAEFWCTDWLAIERR